MPRSRVSSSPSPAKGVRSSQRTPRSRACSRSSAMERNEAVPRTDSRSMGTLLPPAALAQPAWRNSSLVDTRSCALVRTRSGSHATRTESVGSTSRRVSMPSTRAGASDSIPSTAMPCASLSRMSATPGSWSARAAARSRTEAVRSSSRHGGAHNPCSVTSSERWSATLNQRISSTVSPQNSTRRGCSSVGGKTSRMPPRTANSPRRSTRSTRAYAAAARSSTTFSRGASSPADNATGRSSPRPLAIGWRTARTGATTTARAPCETSPASGCARRRSTESRWPTVSERGDRRSCGSVSHEGKRATASAPRLAASAAWRSSASRPVAVTARTGAPEGRGARAATTAGRAPGGEVASTSADGTVSASARRVRPGSAATRERSGEREGMSPSGYWRGPTAGDGQRGSSTEEALT